MNFKNMVHISYLSPVDTSVNPMLNNIIWDIIQKNKDTENQVPLKLIFDQLNTWDEEMICNELKLFQQSNYLKIQDNNIKIKEE